MELAPRFYRPLTKVLRVGKRRRLLMSSILSTSTLYAVAAEAFQQSGKICVHVQAARLQDGLGSARRWKGKKAQRPSLQHSTNQYYEAIELESARAAVGTKKSKSKSTAAETKSIKEGKIKRVRQPKMREDCNVDKEIFAVMRNIAKHGASCHDL